MVNDRKKYVMSVDLAMKREMSYREKIETLTAEQCSNISVVIPQNSLPSQVQSSTLTQTPTPRTTPTPRPNPNPNPYRPTQMIIPNQNPYRPPQMIIPNQNPHRPTFAQGSLPRPNIQHLGPTLNPISLIRPPLIRTSRPTYPAHQNFQKKKMPARHQPKRIKAVSPEDFYCKLCQVDCVSEISLRMHLKGQKHKSKLRNEQVKKVVAVASEANDKLYCELCGVWCPDMNGLTMHLNGKNHYLKQRAHEMKMNGPDGTSSVA